MERKRLTLRWELGRHAAADTEPEAWFPAAVPGAVQLDWARAHGLPDYTVGRAVEREWADLDESWWTYRTRIEPAPRPADGGRVFLVIDGLDYAGEVWLDDERVAGREGLQTPVAVDVTDRLIHGTTVRVRLAPAPKSRPAPKDRGQANRSCKPAVSYGWDFHPRLVPLGLWRPAYLERRAAVHFAARPSLDYRLSADHTRAEGRVNVRLSGAASASLRVRWSLRAPAGTAVVSVERVLAAGETNAALRFAVEQPELWWPHDQGTPTLYASEMELLDTAGRVLDGATARVGFRRVRLVMAPDQWKKPTAFPKSRSDPPITLEVNGRPLFVKGSNWVCPGIFPGEVTRERYAEQLALVRASHLGLLRLWGGAVAPPDDFYELCDELGIMVWQEFPLACNDYPDEPDYLAVLDQESRSLIARLAGHASVVLWCGGNELFNHWSGMTDQSLALRLLNRNCYELDPTRPFLATSPLGGMGHGHYTMRDPVNGDEAWALFQDARCTAYTEFGCPGPASVETLRRIIPADELWPPRAGTSWETHHAFGAWLPSSHLYLEELEFYFGPMASLEQLVECGQLLQGLALQGLFEEARRQKPVASMALNWCFNEPWPAAAGNNLVGWPCEPKPALRLVAAACRRVLASARIRKLSWSPGERFAAELWLLNDGAEPLPATEVAAWLVLDGGRFRLGAWKSEPVPANTNARGPMLEWPLSDIRDARFGLELEVAGRPDWNSHYTLLRARTDRAAPRAAVAVPAGATNF